MEPTNKRMEQRDSIFPPLSNPHGRGLLTSSRVAPFQLTHLNFLLGFLQLLLHFSQILLDLLILALEERLWAVKLEPKTAWAWPPPARQLGNPGLSTPYKVLIWGTSKDKA